MVKLAFMKTHKSIKSCATQAKIKPCPYFQLENGCCAKNELW